VAVIGIKDEKWGERAARGHRPRPEGEHAVSEDDIKPM